MKREPSRLILILALCLPAAAARADTPQKNVPVAWEFLSPANLGGLPPLAGEPNATLPKLNRSFELLNLWENGLKVKTDYIEKQPGDDLKSLSPGTPQPGEVKALVTSSIVDRLLNAEGELAYSSPDSQKLLGIGEETHRLLRFGLKGGWTNFAYGAEYRSVGKDFINLAGPGFAADQEGAELWTEQKYGIFSFRESFSRFTDNAADDPARPLTTRALGGASLAIARPAWPIVSFFYTGGLLSTSREPDGFTPQRGALHSLGTSLQYRLSGLEATLASAYSLNDIASRAGAASSRVATRTPLFSLALNYRPTILPMKIHAFGSYTTTKTSDGGTDNNGVNLSGALAWELGASRAGKNTLFLGGTFNRRQDVVNPGASNKDASVWVRVKIAGF
ncbi:MAG TPA: hypothetical protein VGA73_11985 [Candidatus Binatia bacterium]